MKNLYKNIAYVVVALSLTACASKPLPQVQREQVKYYLHGMQTDSYAIAHAKQDNPAIVCIGNDSYHLDGSFDYQSISCW